MNSTSVSGGKVRILLVSATFSEVRIIFNKSDITARENEFLSSHKLNGTCFDILVTGVGIASTAYRLGKTLARNKYDFVINAGIAGAFSRDLKIGEVVNVCSDVIADLGAENGSDFLPLDKLNIGKSDLAKTVWKTESISEIKNPVINSLKKVKGITVNTVHGNKINIEKIAGLFASDTETMEGAAFLHICNEEKISCAQIRAISNYVEDRNTAGWRIAEATEKLNDVVIKIFETCTLQ